MNNYISKIFLAVITLLVLGLFLLSEYFQKNSSTNIIFTPMYDYISLNCQASFFHLDNQGTEISNRQKWQYQQLQFFIHNIEVKTKQNNWQPWLMTTNSHQSNNVALLGEVCNEIHKQSYWELELISLAKPEDITDIRFTLGIPFSLNHLNPLTQPSPLNMSSMFWGWQGGHKFMRIELISKNDDWLFHLGSTGCKALSPVRAPKGECLQPNRALVSLPFTKKTTNIEVNLAVLFHDLVLKRKNSCQSSPNEKSCKALFENLGLNKINNTEQLLFRAKINE